MSSGSSTPLVTSSPSQSWAPMTMSGPSPAGAARLSCSRIWPNSSSCTATVMPFSSANDVGDLLDDGLACVVGPDHEVGVAAGGRRRWRRARRARWSPRPRSSPAAVALGRGARRRSCPRARSCRSRRWCRVGTAGIVVVVVTAGGGDEREAGEHRQSGRPERASAHDPPSMVVHRPRRDGRRTGGPH